MKRSKLLLILCLLIAQACYSKTYSDTTKVKLSTNLDSVETATAIDLVYGYEKYKALDSLNNIRISEWKAKYEAQNIYSDTLEANFERKETAWNSKFLLQNKIHSVEIRQKNIYLGVSMGLNVVQFIFNFNKLWK